MKIIKKIFLTVVILFAFASCMNGPIKLTGSVAPNECQSRELHKITEKVSYLLRSLVLKPLFFLASPRQPLLDKTCVYTATFICILYLKRTTIQNSEYFTRLLFTSLNSIYSVANVLNILYTKTSKIANFSTTFSMLVLFIPYEYMSHG